MNTIKVPEVIEVNTSLLERIDVMLAFYEDIAYGEEGKEATSIRGELQKLLKT